MKYLGTWKFYFTVVLVSCLFAGLSDAAGPKILFSDVTDAPTSGWERSSTKGAAVTIWCRNIGSSRGSSYVTVSGVKLTDSSDYAEWGETTQPTVPIGMQRITFFLNATIPIGGSFPNTEISVTTAEGKSNSIPFHTRALGSNRIYFIDVVNGAEENDGLTAASAKKTTGWARANLKAGDIAYIRDSGIPYTSENSHDDDTANYQFCKGGLFSFCDYSGGGGVSNHNNGVQGKSISVLAYPGESPQMTPLTSDGAASFMRTVWEELEYWTFAKFTVNGLRPMDNKENVFPPYSGYLKHIIPLLRNLF